MYIPIFGALALASGTILEKIVLKKRNIKTTLYQVASFLGIILVMLPFIPFLWKINPEAFSIQNIFIFILVVAFSILANYFVFYSMKWEKLSNLEPVKMMEPLFVILLVIIFSFFFGQELYDRQLKIIIPAIIAGGALVFSHIKKHHLDFNKYFRAALLGSLFFAVELVISRLILDFYSPVTFYFLRCSAVFLLSLIFFRPNFSKLDKKSIEFILFTSIIWFIYRIVIYYGYTSLGIIETTLMIMLGPVFIYFFAWKFLKEKLNWRNIVASIIIIICVIYGILA